MPDKDKKAARSSLPIGSLTRSSNSSNQSIQSLGVPKRGRHSYGPGGHQIKQIDDGSRYKVMIKYLHSKVSANNWLADKESGLCSLAFPGVLLRKGRSDYVTEPEQVDPILLAAVQRINAEAAFTMATETTHLIFSALTQTQSEIVFPSGSQLQVVDSLADIVRLGKIRKLQYAALVREERVLLLWHDSLDKILLQASQVEEKLLALVWGTGDSPFNLQTSSRATLTSTRNSRAPSPSPSLFLNQAHQSFSFKSAEACVDEIKIESDAENPAESLARPLVLTSTIFVGLAIFLMLTTLLGFGVSNVVFEVLTDHYWPRLALVATEPIFLVLSIFFAVVIFTDIFQALGPITGLKTNSRFYSANAPNLQQAYSLGFEPPHITIQMPVFKESLRGVIQPTVTSLKAAISHYESHGGTATVFVNDDGLVSLPVDEANARLDFYHDNNIGWVARPRDKHDGFVRKGKFKKASNMNFALNMSNQVEERLCNLIYDRFSLEDKAELTAHDEDTLYRECLNQVLAQDKRVQAGGNIRIGEHILLVDSDTRVPEDCLLFAAAELFLSPEVAILQHNTGVMQVSHDYFENGITYFTNLIYSSVRFAVANGETAAFVGHNAFIRWEALQSIGVPEKEYVAYWSERHVSEDFDVALRMQVNGNIVRMAAYHGDGFREGVSLTIYDELARWEKYAFGCNELVFNPCYTWLWRGPFTKVFLKFLFSPIHLSSKVTIIGYISTYYALAAGLPLTTLNYFLIGWMNGWLDKFYLDSWKVFLSLVLVFSFVGNVTMAVLRFRLGEKPLFSALCENFKWMPMFTIFFSGLPFHMCYAIVCHAFGIPISWGSTAKEKEQSNFFKEVPRIFRRFWAMYLFMIPFVGGMIYLGCFAPRGWEIDTVVAVVPTAVMVGCHLLVPFVLNPSVMVFNY